MITKDLLEKQFLKERYEHEMLQVKLETQEDTFQLIGKELHDNIGQLLSTSRLLLGLTERNLEQPPETLLNANLKKKNPINQMSSL
jgi:signal transduction histidine kinase